MMYFEKSQPPPPCLEDEKLKKTGSYYCGDVLERLKIDFKNKCYICEQATVSSFKIDHFKPHENINIELKFDWNNLFLACDHCNGIKGNRFKSILNCTNPSTVFTEKIHIEFDVFAAEHVRLTALDSDTETLETVKLLEEVYNASRTKNRALNSANLRDLILTDIIEFSKLLHNFLRPDNTDDLTEYYSIQIRKHISKSSSFTTIKRQIIIEKEKLKMVFEQYFD